MKPINELIFLNVCNRNGLKNIFKMKKLKGDFNKLKRIQNYKK
jgi:hypothetical protein